MRPDFEPYGFPQPDNLIQAFIGGSQLHSAKVGSTDWYGVFIEPPAKMIGLDRDEFFVFTTGGNRGGNGPDDIDVCLYSLRKRAGMAAKGNPSALHFVFAGEELTTVWWKRITEHRDLFASRHHLKPFVKFADDPMERLFGRKGQKSVHWAGLEQEFGYDTKYAMHVIRFYLEANEDMEAEKITLPNPKVDLLIATRLGKYTLPEIEELGKQLEADATQAQANSPLPAEVDLVAITKVTTEIYMGLWTS